MPYNIVYSLTNNEKGWKFNSRTVFFFWKNPEASIICSLGRRVLQTWAGIRQMPTAIESVTLLFRYRSSTVIIVACPGKVFGCLAALSAPHDVLLILITATQTKTERTARLLKVALPLPRYSFFIFPPVKSKEKTGRVFDREIRGRRRAWILRLLWRSAARNKRSKRQPPANMSEMMKALQR